MTELWTDLDSLAAAIDAAPDALDLNAAYLAEARVTLGEDRVAELGPLNAILELGKTQAARQLEGALPPYATVHEQVALITAKRLLPFLREHPEHLHHGDAVYFMTLAPQFSDIDPSGMQFRWAMRACQAILAGSDVPERPSAFAGAAFKRGTDNPRPMFP